MNPNYFNPYQQQQYDASSSSIVSQVSFVGGANEAGSNSTTTAAADNKKKTVNNTKGCRPVTIHQIKTANIVGESTYQIDNDDVSYVTFIAVVRNSTIKNDNNILYQMEDGTGAIDVRRWRLTEENYDEINNLIAPDMYVRVIGRISQFNGQISNVAAHHISIIRDFNEMTMHFLDTIYIHLTINKLDVIATMNRLQVREGGNYTLAEKELIVKRAIQENYMSEGGAFIPQVKNCLKDTLTFQEIDHILDDLIGVTDQAYFTIDMDHIRLVDGMN